MLTNLRFHIFGDAFYVLHFYCIHFQAIFSFKKTFYEQTFNNQQILKIKESLLISRDQPVFNKNEDICHYICLISYTNVLQSYDYLVLPFIHYYLLFVVFSDKIYPPVGFKIVLKVF